MILFYSEFCEHSKMLLESIKRHDSQKQIKMVSIEAIRNNNMAIDPKIHSVPAMLFPKTNEVIFGKAVFDYLFLPGRGKLLMGTSNTKDRDTEVKTEPTGAPQAVGEPIAYVSSIIGQDFESLDATDNKNDISFKWGTIDGHNDQLIDTRAIPDEENKKKLPSMEDIMKMRDLDDVWKNKK